MERYFRVQFDVDLALSLYEEYDKFPTKDLLNHAVMACMPFVRLVFIKQIGYSQKANQKFIEADGLHAIQRCIEGREIPTDTPRRFTSFLYTAVHRAFIDSIKSLRSEEFDYLYNGKGSPHSTYGHPLTAERKLQAEEVREQVYLAVKSAIRFVGNERDACLFILDCLTGRSRQSPEFVRRRYNIKKLTARYLVKYVTILLKHEMLEHQAHERRNSSVPSLWETGRSVLRTPNEHR